ERVWSHPLRLALLSAVFNHHAHAMLPVVVRDIAHDPNARVIHLDNRRDSLGCAQPKSRHGHWPGDRVAIHRNYREVMPWQRKTPDLGRAPVQHVEKHTFALLYPYWLAASQHSAIDGEGTIPDLESVRRTFGERGLHGVFAGIFQIL